MVAIVRLDFEPQKYNKRLIRKLNFRVIEIQAPEPLQGFDFNNFKMFALGFKSYQNQLFCPIWYPISVYLCPTQ
jgi:hypothetical protein